MSDPLLALRNKIAVVGVGNTRYGSFPDISDYGLGAQAQVRAHDVRAVGARMQFRVTRSNGITLPDMQIDLNLDRKSTRLNSSH